MSHYVIGVIVPANCVENYKQFVEYVLAPYDENLKVAPYKKYMDVNALESMRKYYSSIAWKKNLTSQQLDVILAEIGITEITLEMVKENLSSLDGGYVIRSAYIDENQKLCSKSFNNILHIYSQQEISELSEKVKPILLDKYFRALSANDITLEYKKDYTKVYDFIKKHNGHILTDQELLNFMQDWHGSSGGIDENGVYYICTYNPNSKWDWYDIGGRWNGMLAKIDPKDNPNNYETCLLCNGTGRRNDELGKETRAKDPGYTCNGCNGKGTHLKMASEWKDEGGNFASVTDTISLMCGDKNVGFFGLVTPDGEWLERGEMGWFACVNYNQEDCPNPKNYTNNENGREQYQNDLNKFENTIKEKWQERVLQILAQYSEDFLVVVVDCHI